MLGVLLPAILQKWGLRDDAAGFLFLLQFLGSSLGAILTGTNRVRTLIAGYGFLVASSCALVFAGLHTLFAIFFFFGLGLGMAMTATSLLISDRYGNDRATKLERLNFAWAAGATAGPMLFLPFLRLASLSPLFFTFQGLFLLLLVWVIFRVRQGAASAQSMTDALPQRDPAPLSSLLPLVALAMCAVGIESALSGWLATYSHRADPRVAGGAAVSTSLFWFGIMFRRLVFSTKVLAMIGRRRLLGATLCGVAVSIALLILTQQTATIRVGSGLAGLSIGPLYPLLLSFILERSPRGWIFAVAGLGSAFLPWLTGMLSAHYGSLRYGLIVPFVAALLMIALRSISLRPPATDLRIPSKQSIDS